MKKVGIIFAMEEELNTFINLVDVKVEEKVFDLSFKKAIVNNLECIMTICGVGKVNAARTTQIMIDKYSVDCIINIGVAGGISNNLQIGDIVIGERIVQHDFDITAFNHEKGYIPNIGVFIDCDKNLVSLVREVINENYHLGIIASGDIFCTDNKMSEKINHKFSALCVEMEGASIAQVCKLDNVPFLVLRSISDIPNNQNVISYEEFLETSSKRVSEVLMKLLQRL